MHTAQIFNALILIASSFSWAETAFNGFMSKINEAEKEITSLKKPDEKVARVKKLLKDLEASRKKAVRDSESNEISMELFVASFNNLPDPKTFKESACRGYLNNFNVRMKGRDDAEVDILVDRAEQIWKKICPD